MTRGRSQLLAACILGGWSLTVQAVAADEPTKTECIFAINHGEDLRQAGKLLMAKASFAACEARSCPDALREDCTKRRAALVAAIPSIVLEAKDASGRDVPDVRVTIDGQPRTTSLDSTPIDLDPGEHKLTFEAAGRSKIEEILTVREGDKVRHEQVLFGPPVQAADRPPVTGALLVRPASSSLRPPSVDERPGLGAQKILAITAGSIGVAAVGLGTAFAIVALSKKSDAESACPASQCATRDGVSKWSSASSAGNISTFAFIAGGVGIAGAGVLWLTARSPSTGSRVQVGFGPGGLRMNGSW